MKAYLPILLALSTLNVYALDLSDATISDIKKSLKNGEVTSEYLVEQYIKRIEKYDDTGPTLNAVTLINPEALELAKNWDNDNKKKDLPLGGIPFLIKDNYDAKGLVTNAGSIALNDNLVKKNATLVQLLIDNGAILLGKTNMSELAASYGKLGYSSYGGQTLNPLNLKRDPSGSSSGSASAVSSGLAAFSLGSDTSGSIRGPASVTGLVGFRPSIGLTSRNGVVPLSLTADTTGPITRSVGDLALILDVIAKEDENDEATTYYPNRDNNFEKALSTATLKGKRFAFITNFSGANSDVDDITKNSLDVLTDNGAKVINVKLPSTFENLWSEVLGPIGDAEFRSQFNSYLAGHNSDKRLKDVVEQLQSKMALESSTPPNLSRVQGLQSNLMTLTSDGPKYIAIQNRLIPQLRTKLSKIAEDNEIDAFVFATQACPAAPLYGLTDNSFKCESNDIWAAGYIASALGYPEISVPAGLAAGNMPVSLSFMSTFGQDEEVIGFGKAFEDKVDFDVEVAY
ncbi:amidase family protein [Psychromonas sp. SP041]|uniref:amidase n=1 Tax=Psychromonas sp. SP041 TaxID=1365007 RepID=UPI0010C7D581|nr:amidase family protein [Psychromonas sp. SP041]